MSFPDTHNPLVGWMLWFALRAAGALGGVGAVLISLGLVV